MGAKRRLRDTMSEDLALRGMSANTIATYVGCVRRFAQYQVQKERPDLRRPQRARRPPVACHTPALVRTALPEPRARDPPGAA